MLHSTEPERSEGRQDEPGAQRRAAQRSLHVTRVHVPRFYDLRGYFPRCYFQRSPSVAKGDTGVVTRNTYHVPRSTFLRSTCLLSTEPGAQRRATQRSLHVTRNTFHVPRFYDPRGYFPRCYFQQSPSAAKGDRTSPERSEGRQDEPGAQRRATERSPERSEGRHNGRYT